MGCQPTNATKKILTPFDLFYKQDKFEFALDPVPKGCILEARIFKSKPASIFFYPRFDAYFKET